VPIRRDGGFGVIKRASRRHSGRWQGRRGRENTGLWCSGFLDPRPRWRVPLPGRWHFQFTHERPILARHLEIDGPPRLCVRQGIPPADRTAPGRASRDIGAVIEGSAQARSGPAANPFGPACRSAGWPAGTRTAPGTGSVHPCRPRRHRRRTPGQQGATIATRGNANGLRRLALRRCSGEARTAFAVTSEPVPAVVGTATNGAYGSVIGSPRPRMLARSI